MQTDKYGQIWIYSKSPFDNAYSNTIKFNNKNEMESFFYTSSLLTEIYYNNTCSYIRRSGTIQVEGDFSKYESASYMRFENETGKMYYAFIIDIQYTREDLTNIIFEVDVFNTYQLEFMETQIQGFVEQCTQKNFKPDGSPNIIKQTQGFNSGASQIAQITALNLNIDWLVFVMKPSVKVNSSDDRQHQFGFPGSFKSFRYFVVPINMRDSRTYAYTYNNTQYKSVTLQTLIDNFTNTFFDGADTNTVNQCVNLYTTKHCGLGYTQDGSVIRIDEIENGIVRTIGTTYTGGNPGGITGGRLDSAVDWSIDLVYNSDTFPVEMVKRFILWCRIFKILPEAILAQVYYESGWGSSEVAKIDNNWSGITWWRGNRTDPAYIETVEVTITRGSARPPVEQGWYCHFESPEDWLAYKMYLIGDTNIYGNSGDSYYNVSGQTTFDGAIKGLFRVGGAQVDYAAQDWSLYLSNCQSIAAGIRTANSDTVIDALNNLVYNDGKWLTNDPVTRNKGLEHLESLLGNKVGSGQCYAIPAEYSGFIGGPHLGAGTQYTPKTGYIPGTAGVAAKAIGDDYDWAQYGWSVVRAPVTIDQVQVGDIVCWDTNQPGYSGNSGYGHTAVIYGVSVDRDQISIFESNWGVLYTTQRTIPWSEKACTCIIHPPASETGYYSGGGYTGDYRTSVNYSASLLEVILLKNLKPLEVQTVNCLNIVDLAIKEALGPFEKIESQIYSGEFCGVRMFDPYGSSYTFSPEYIVDEDNTVIITGAIADSNHIHYTLKNYSEIDDPMNDAFKMQKFNYGLTDSNPRSLTILSDAVDTFFQANKNQYEAQQRAFNENADILQKSTDLSVRQVDLTNTQATYNSDYAITSAKIGLAESGFNALTGVIGNYQTGGIVGGVAAAGSGALNIFNSARGLQNSQMQGQFTDQANSLRSESNSLSNMQAKLALNQSIRSFNASQKDLDNQPTSIIQVGTDLSFQVGNNLDDIYLSFEIPNENILDNANKYIRAYGVILNKWFDDIRTVFEQRQKFNYIKCTDLQVRNIEINQSHYNALRAVFLTGTRVWNYSKTIDNDYMRLNGDNDDK